MSLMRSSAWSPHAKPPSFCYQGFQYVEVRGWEEELTPDAVSYTHLAALDRMRREAARTLPLWKRALLFLLAG